MARIKIQDYIKDVELNRQRLVQYCNDVYNTVPANSSLSNIVNVIESTRPTILENTNVVQFIDIDGSKFAANQNIKLNGKIDFTNVIEPNYDPEYLEFVEYATDAEDLNNITYPSDVVPRYQVKADSEGRRWTILKCNLSPFYEVKTLSISIYKKPASSIFTIDWGDGNTENITNTSSYTFSHTYDDYGKYVIKIYCDGDWYFPSYIFGSGINNRVLEDLYIGDNMTSMPTWTCTQCVSLKTVVFSNSVKSLGTGALQYCTNLRVLLFPDNAITFSTHQIVHYDYSLETIILSKTSNTIFSMSELPSLRKLVIPEGIVTTPQFSGTRSLYFLKLPSTIEILSGFIETYRLNNFIISENIRTINGTLPSVDTINIPASVTTLSASAFSDRCIKNIYLYDNFNLALDFRSTWSLSKESIIRIAKSLKDNAQYVAKTIKFKDSQYTCNHKNILLNTFVDKNGNEVPYVWDSNNTSLLDYILNKNWTVTFAD